MGVYRNDYEATQFRNEHLEVQNAALIKSIKELRRENAYLLVIAKKLAPEDPERTLPERIASLKAENDALLQRLACFSPQAITKLQWSALIFLVFLGLTSGGVVARVLFGG